MYNLLVPRSLGRRKTRDTAFTYRMGGGFAGDVNRGHPASIQPCLIDPTNPPTLSGQAVVVVAASQGVRPLAAGDGALTDIWGVIVRSFPFQQALATGQYGAIGYGVTAPAAAMPVDVLVGGYIFVSVVGSPVKGGPVYIWTAAAAGAHVQGGFEAVNPAGNGIALNAVKFAWNSPPDSTGVAELKITL